MNKYLPEAPTNVRGVVNGVEIPMKLRYIGVGQFGENVWAALWPEGMEMPEWEDFDGMRADKLPEMCSLVAMAQPGA